MIQLSNDQEKAIEVLFKWFNSPKKRQYITLGGYAGTGKTTVISIFRAELHKLYPDIKVAFCSYTGKAARVLKNKLKESKSVLKKDSISTIHSLIYAPMLSKSGEIIGWELKEQGEFDLVIVDEASMVDNEIWKDLLSLGKPIIAVGDHGQLPPIRGNFNLMQKPDIKLEQIHRQAEGNPIIHLSILAREKGEVPFGTFNNKVRKYNRNEEDSKEYMVDQLNGYRDDTLVLCGYNTTRVRLNKFIRSSLEIETERPTINDRVICLKNNHKKHIYNGMLGKIKSIQDERGNTYFAKIEFDDEDTSYSGLIDSRQFNNKESIERHSKEIDIFDFGYAITVHKAQGSQARKVVLFEERFPKMDDETWRRWLYTAITRAAEELVIFG